MSISVVIPLRDAASVVAPLLEQLQALRGARFEVIVVEATPGVVAKSTLSQLADRWEVCPPGRALQLQAGADLARHSVLWFLHADSRDIGAAAVWMNKNAVVADNAHAKGAWGRFDVAFDDPGRILGCVAWFMNGRSRLTRVCTGDQGIWLSSRLLRDAGGWPQQPLMEDVELTKRLRRRVEPQFADRRGACPVPTLTTSARRWRRDGTLRTILLMWHLRLRYALGANPEALHAIYYGDPAESPKRKQAAARASQLSESIDESPR